MKTYFELIKLRIAVMVGATCAVGFYMGAGRGSSLLLWSILGTVLASFAAGAFNQVMEKGPDSSMKRTENRPLPGGHISFKAACSIGAFCAVLGLAILFWKVNFLACLLAALTLLIYLGAYTPLKRISPLSTWFGSAAGAIPPLIGWVSATGTLSAGAWILFAVQFLWQIPHFLALFWLYREDYARAGFRVMPVVDSTGRATGLQIAIHSFAVLPMSLLPGLMGMAQATYTWGAFILGAVYMGAGMKASWSMNSTDMKRLFLVSLGYLPVLFALMVLNKT